MQRVPVGTAAVAAGVVGLGSLVVGRRQGQTRFSRPRLERTPRRGAGLALATPLTSIEGPPRER